MGIKVVKIGESDTSRNCSLCGDAHKNGRIKRGLYKCPRTGKAINADLNSAVNILHIPESLGSRSRGQLLARDRGNGLKTQPVVYRWTSRAGWVKKHPTSHEAMRMKAVNHKPMIRPEGTPALQGGEEVSNFYIFASISRKRLLANTNSEELARKIEKMGEVEFSSPCG